MPKKRQTKPKYTTRDTLELITPELLWSWLLPQPDEQSDKEDRGRVLVIGGAVEMPGAIILAATAALRAGAGKLRIATGRSIALMVGVAVPEARVFGLPETSTGGIDPSAAEDLVERANQVQATLIGPGMTDEATVSALLDRLMPQLKQTTLVLDATALLGGVRNLAAYAGQVILTPNVDEMAQIADMAEAAVQADPQGAVCRAAASLGAVVTLKDAETYIAAPDGPLYQYRSGNVGLATSGSGDILAGVIAGLAARGASPVQAAVWGVYLHGEAGNRLARRLGRLGFLARELLAEIPLVMAEFDPLSPSQS
jgi:ADP-dependent NAD(P)H-hydrate dehydratase